MVQDDYSIVALNLIEVSNNETLIWILILFDFDFMKGIFNYNERVLLKNIVLYNDFDN